MHRGWDIQVVLETSQVVLEDLRVFLEDLPDLQVVLLDLLGGLGRTLWVLPGQVVTWWYQSHIDYRT